MKTYTLSVALCFVSTGALATMNCEVQGQADMIDQSTHELVAAVSHSTSASLNEGESRAFKIDFQEEPLMKTGEPAKVDLLLDTLKSNSIAINYNLNSAEPKMRQLMAATTLGETLTSENENDLMETFAVGFDFVETAQESYHIKLKATIACFQSVTGLEE